MKRAGLALVLLVVSCSGASAPRTGNATSAASVVASSPAPAATPAASAAPPAFNPPSPSWTLGLGATAVSTVDFSCRLPVFDDEGHGPTGGFINFPSGTVTPDPAAAVSNAHLGRELTSQGIAHYYDRAYSRWLPVSRNAISPDGSHYAYADRALGAEATNLLDSTMHVVDVKTGAEKTFADGTWAAPYEVLDYAAEGIYLITPFAGENGLWLMNPDTGEITHVARLSTVQGSGGHKIFWLGSVNPNDPQPIAGVAPDEIDRFNLADGTETMWFYQPGASAHFVSQDEAGHPILIVGGVSGPLAWVIVPAPGVSRWIWTSGNQVPGLSSPIADRHGIWFGDPSGIFLYSEANGMQKVSNQPGYPANGCF